MPRSQSASLSHSSAMHSGPQWPAVTPMLPTGQSSGGGLMTSARAVPATSPPSTRHVAHNPPRRLAHMRRRYHPPRAADIHTAKR
jgi:hypothetical protein